MTLTYTALGLVVAAAGLQFQAALQRPYMLIGLAIVFTLLVMSMFGSFTLQLPSSLQTRLTSMNNRQQGDSPGGVFVMGAIARLICSPCTIAPLSAVLLYIVQSGNMWLGDGTLYLYALDMGLPLMLITVFGNRLLSKNGPRTEQIKAAFGFVILALPVFLLGRVIGDVWELCLWSALGVVFFDWAFITSLQVKRGRMRVMQTILLIAALISMRPLQDWAFGTTRTTQTQTHLSFTQIKTVDELNQVLTEAEDKPVMLGFYADWYIACKEFEKYIFSDPQVQKALTDMVLLQANVTINGAQDTALLKHPNVLGPPTILFLDGQGQEHPQAHVTGLMDTETFGTHLHDRQPWTTLTVRKTGENSMQHEDVLRETLKSLELQGITNTTLEMVAERMDYPLDELCRFWPDKEAILYDALRYLNRQIDVWHRQLMLDETQTTEQELLVHYQTLSECVKNSRYPGCLFAAAYTFYPDPGHPIHQLVGQQESAAYDFTHELLTTLEVDDLAMVARQMELMLGDCLSRMLVNRSQADVDTAHWLAEDTLRFARCRQGGALT